MGTTTGMTRRQWLQGGVIAGGAAATGAALNLTAPRPPRPASPYFGLHPFIEANPGAVFIRRTHVAHKLDEPAKRREGIALAREIFVPLEKPGIPLTHRIVVKVNATVVQTPDRPDVELWGTSTDPQFYEGMVLGLKELGLKKFYFLEANHFERWNLHGFVDINEQHGIEMNEPERRIRNFRDGYEMTWSKVPDPVIYTRIPHYAPVNEPDTWLLNIAKWKGHSMCLTQSVKNDQGLVVLPYVRFCAGLRMVTGVPDFMKPDVHTEAEPRVKRYFANHRKLGYSRYDAGPEIVSFNQEIWAHKTCDNQSVLKTGLAMIEGIYARDGDGFRVGDDQMTNLVMFGKDKFRLDLVGLYLGGHEPGNVHLYRIAKERGLSSTFNPWDVPIYEWRDGEAIPSKLTDFPRTPLKSPYMTKAGEPRYHLANEPFDYDRVKV